MEESGNLSIFPAATIRVSSKDGEELSLVMLIDSGATISGMPKHIAPLLGINLKKGKPLRVFGVQGTYVRAWRHDISVQIGKNILKLPMAFLDDEHAPRVLGREGIFDHFTVAFTETERCSALFANETNEAQAINAMVSKLDS